MVKKLHDSVEQHIKKKNEQYVTIANKGHRQVIFELGIGFGCIWERKDSQLVNGPSYNLGGCSFSNPWDDQW